MKRLFFLYIVFGALHAYGQNTMRPSLYFQNMNYYNPAAVLTDTAVDYHISVYGKQKIVENDVWTKPANVFINHIGRIRSSSSFYSAAYVYDSYSFYDRYTFYGGYSHEWTLPKNQYLSIGARGVLNMDKVYWDRLSQIENKNNNSLYLTPDVDLGVHYRIKRWAIGVASKNFFGTYKKVEGEKLLQNQREWYTNLSYSFPIKQRVMVSPFLLLQKERTWDIDLGMNVAVVKKINLAYMFRLKEIRHIYSIRANVWRGSFIGGAVDHSGIHSDVNIDFLLGYNF
jgi:hypothetical protein